MRKDAERMETENAKITHTMLGTENRGILSVSVVLEFGIGSRMFGDYDLRWGERMLVWIREMLAVGAVSKWEDLPGQYVRARFEDGFLTAIGHITEDIWFTPGKDLPEDKPAFDAYVARREGVTDGPDDSITQDDAPDAAEGSP